MNMNMEEKLSLKWNEFEKCSSQTFKDLLEEKDFTDVTLVTDEEKLIRAHKVILSACSPFFQRILKKNINQNPLIYLHNIRCTELQAIIEFMYLGQTEVLHSDLEKFMKVGRELQINPN